MTEKKRRYESLLKNLELIQIRVVGGILCFTKYF